MKLLTRNTDYGVRALCFIAKEKERIVSVTELVKALKMPRPFLRKILQAMNKSGLLESYKGKGGGFKLKRHPRYIFITDLLEIFQGPLKVNGCLFKKRPCPNKAACKLRKKIQKIEKSVIGELGSITVLDLI